MILAGDIGGTKTLLALYQSEGATLQQITRKIYDSQGHAAFAEILADFTTSVDLSSLSSAALGIAGPIIDQTCNTTNLPWAISGKSLQGQLGLEKVFLLNDLEATAYGMTHLPASDFSSLNRGEPGSSGNIAVIAAGTGLGEALLYHQDDRWHPIATEGGHCEFAPQTSQQDNLLHWLRNHYPEHVSLERILSGPGIVSLYQFLLDTGFSSPPEEFPATNTEALPDAREISFQALTGNHPLCVETLRLFTEIYGAEAGNLALKSLSRGGVFIGGGIAPKILPLLKNGVFMDAFTRKGRFSNLMQSMPVRVSLNQETALIGAAYFAHDHE